MTKWYDSYTLKAIYFPTMIFLISPIINIYLFIMVVSIYNTKISTYFNTMPKLVTSLLPIILYFLSITFTRTSGRNVQQKLINQWDGFPSTRFARFSDSKFSKEFKQNLHKKIETKFQITLLSPTDEHKNPHEADKKINEAFVLIKDWLRMHDKQAFWQKHNIDYGFYRNLLGCKKAWSTLNIVFGLMSFLTFFLGIKIFILYLMINTLIITLSIIILKAYLPKAVRISAEQYAESAWASFYNLNA